MSLTPMLFIVVGAIVVVVLAITIYNGLVSLKNQVERAWSNIDVILKQRFDEIPQLIQVVEQYAGHESNMIKKVTDARTHYGQAKSVGEKIQAAGEMGRALQGLIAIGEAYPELKSNNNFVQLQSRVSDLEGTIADRRESYNEAVTNFNTRIEQLPDIFFARMLGYTRREMFAVPAEEKVKPSLKMNLPT
jgi:LemA protein